MAESCPFCAIDRERNRILAEEKNVVVVLSNPRLMEGHTLVLPRRHVSALSHLPGEERDDLFETAISFQEKIKRLVAPGCDLSQHDRVFMPTTKVSIPSHVHIHLRPRSWQDNYYQRVLKHETQVFQDLFPEEARRFQHLLAE